MKKTRKIAIYGGSFNPIHNAHVNIALLFIKKLKLDKLLLIPTAESPHKDNSEMVSAQARLDMCKLAVKNFKKIEVSDIEIKREGKSYTIDTLTELEKIYPDTELYLIMGSDMFMTFLEWKNPEAIMSKAIICTVPRDDDNITALCEMEEKYKAMGAKTIVLDVKKSDVSSTQIRRNVFDDKSISKLVCEDVERYIFANYIYMNKGNVNYTRFQAVLKSRMSDKRFIHSVAVADEAVRLAKKYGADEEKAKIAGLLHDITKETPHDEQVALMERFNIPLTDLEKVSQKLWHAISGAAFVKYIIGIDDEDICNAIRYHTSGRANMSVLEKCIFIADFTSAERNYNGVEEMRNLSNKSLEEAMRYGLSFSISDLASKCAAIDPNALACYNEVVLQLAAKK